jgi:small-conductance mechanosensitive channel
VRHRASIRRSIRVALAGVALCTALVSAQSDMPPATGVGPGTAGSSPAASTRPPATAPAAPERRTGATLSLYNRPLMTFRAPMLGAAPADRAEVARVRVTNLLEGGAPAVVSLNDVPQGTALLVDDQFAFIVTHEDALLTDGGGARQLAERVAEALRRVVAETRESRDSAFLVRAAIAAGIATVLFLCLVVLTRWVWRRVARALMELAQRHAERLTIGGGEVISRERAIATARQGVAVIATLALFLLAWEWLSYVLALFPYTRPWSEELRSFLGRAALGVLESVARSLPTLMVAILIFVVARFVDGVQRRFFDRVEAGKVALAAIDRDTAPATRRLATIAVWLFAVAMAYPYIPGSETDAFKGLSVLLGLMVSVGASGIVGQAASGLILMYTRTYRPGEFVQIGGRDGTVIAMGLFTTKVRTGMGEELTLPNSLVMGSIVTNHSRGARSTGFVAQTSVTIGYDVPWRQVHAMLEDAARRTDGVCATPPPRVFQTALSDFYVEYRLACEVAASEPGARIAVISALNAAIQDVFNEHGVQIMSPHYYSDPEQPKIVPPARWHAPPARTR